MARTLHVSLLALLLATTTQARINVVTLPERDSVQLTIYNSADLTLVKETRHLTFRKGLNKLEFSWANTLIDPTSVEFRPVTNGDKVEVLDVSFPPRVTNTLEWRINSEVAGEVVCEIRYFTSGIHWAADYVAEADKGEQQMNWAGYVRVANNSGEDYENAQVRLVVGVIRLVEQIAKLAREFRRTAEGASVLYYNERSKELATMNEVIDMKDGDFRAVGRAVGGTVAFKAREVVKEALSEFFLYTVEGRDTIPSGWSKRLRSFKASEVPVVSYYKFEKERWNEQVVRHYRFKNDQASKLGNEPLPDGKVIAFRRTSPDDLYALVGHTSVKYIPIGEEVEMELGEDREVTIKPKLMNWQKVDLRFNGSGNVAGWTTKETWEIEVQNSKDIPVTLDIRRNFAGDWTLVTEDKYEKVDATKVKFVVPLKSREKQKLVYELTTRYGTNITR